ncbi:type I DNA topoisomerase [bacterium]|uniref:DNA topoisomerase 1 n=1 Tax=Candidatus Scatenecus faecavium TaxID=2840915 RepID=A0A9D1K3A2_9BACT|nr:type I DNA topoisomerase [bacterium]HIS82720.1 type I DNA topoisomerase [Candidatus Scatenecus faecavium]
MAKAAAAAEKPAKKASNKKEKSLVIVESPAKSKTIRKILGDSFQIEASFGHVRNLPTKDPSTENLGFDIQNHFTPKFEVIPGKQAVVKKLNDLAQKVDKIYLASDPDREGEAIAWHVRQLLKVPDEKVLRIVFNEITPKAVKHSVENPRGIDMDMVQAQQTRQILDKLVGYKLSPVLWKQIGNRNLSAGRVQSVALRMICEREEEIEAFVPQEYWSIHTDLDKDGKVFEAELSKYKNKAIEKTIKNQEEAQKIVDYLKDPAREFEVAKVTKKSMKRKPTAPFITSTLQRAASSKLGFGVQKTMQVAQKLYEGMEIDGTPVGLITYMRTDSVRVSDDAQAMAKDFILGNYGEKYYPETPNIYTKGKQNVQDAHEAIRPSYPERTPDSIKQYLDADQYKLYKLIWNKFMSSQMSNAEIANKSIEIQAGDCILKAGTSKVTFDGFLKLYNDSEEDEKAADSKIPDLEKGDKVICRKITPKQHFTQPPPRYNEASLVKALEEHGIGRPSTYATIITVIQTRKYVEKREKALHPTLLGRTVSKQLVAQFADIMDYKFTAGMESKLDEIADKKLIWNEVLEKFYEPFIQEVNKALGSSERVKIESNIKCPNCGKPMLVKTSRKGQQFLGCSGYPECKTVMSMNVLTENMEGAPSNAPEVCEAKCEKCGSEMVFKQGPYGKYLECTNEGCKFRKPYRRSTGVTCPKCGKGVIVERKSKRGTVFFGCDKYPDCDFVLWNEPTGEVCPDCGGLLVKKELKKGTTIECSNRSCGYKAPVTETADAETPSDEMPAE